MNDPQATSHFEETLSGTPISEHKVGLRLFIMILIINSATIPAAVAFHANEPLLAAYLLLISIATWIYYFWKRGIRVQVFPEGIVYHRWGKQDVVRWEEIEFVWQEAKQWYWIGGIIPIPGPSHSKLTLQRLDGLRLKIDNHLAKFSALYRIVIQESFSRLSKQAIGRYKVGVPVDFDMFRITQDGIRYNSKELPWEELQCYKLYHDTIIIKQINKLWDWASVPIGKIPNFHVFRFFLDTALNPTESTAPSAKS